MKILRITSLGFEGGGAENGIILLQPILKKMGHTVKILTSDLRPEIPHFSDFEFETGSNRPMILKLLYRSFNPSAYFKLKKVLAEYQPDIVQLHTMTQASPSVLFLLKNYPSVMTIHGSEHFTRGLLLWGFPPELFRGDVYQRSNLTFKGWLHYLYHRYISVTIYRLGFKNIDVFVAFSQYMQSYLATEENIRSIHIPNATQLFEYSPINLQSETILCVSRLEKSKGIDYLIQALPEIISVYPRATLLIAGQGDCQSSLENLVSQLGLQNRVHFLGHQNRNQLYELYKNSAVISMPSTWPEPFGKVGIEAMSVGRPVIASDVGGISEWLNDGKTGFLVPPGNAKAIATKIVKLFSDQELLLNMSLEARKRAEDFDIQRHAEKVIELYQSVIDKYKDIGK